MFIESLFRSNPYMQEPPPKEVKQALEVLESKNREVVAHLELLRQQNAERWATTMYQLEKEA